MSTSIGEEGLDIGEVDLIVCYDAQKTPIRMVSDYISWRYDPLIRNFCSFSVLSATTTKISPKIDYDLNCSDMTRWQETLEDEDNSRPMQWICAQLGKYGCDI